MVKVDTKSYVTEADQSHKCILYFADGSLFEFNKRSGTFFPSAKDYDKCSTNRNEKQCLGTKSFTFYFMQDGKRAFEPFNSGKTVDFSFFRNDSLQTLPVSVDTAGLVGIGMRGADHYLPVKHVQYGFFESFPKGIKRGINMLSSYVGDTKMIFSKEGAKQIGGFGTIGSIFPDKWDWQRFWEMTAFLSIALAFMNILPIPALDGGHVLFLLYEVITRRTPNEKFMEYAQITGMALLFGLLLYANGNDLFRFLIK